MNAAARNDSQRTANVRARGGTCRGASPASPHAARRRADARGDPRGRRAFGTSANSSACRTGSGRSNNRVHMGHPSLSSIRHTAELRIVSRVRPRNGWRASYDDDAVREVVGAQLRESLQGHPKARAAALAIVTVLEQQAAAVRFGDLPAEHETNAGTAGFRREERARTGCRYSTARALHPRPTAPSSAERDPASRCHPTVTPPPVSRTASTALRIRLISSCSS